MFKQLLKNIYNVIPFKRNLFRIIKSVASLPPSIFKHLHFKGDIIVKVDKNHNFKIRHYGYQIENELFWQGLFGGWERDSMRLWVELCKRSNVIFDIGANTGVYTLVSKSVNPHASVFAFEPIPRVYEKLLTNIQLNNFDVHAYPMAISSSTGEGFFYDSGNEHLLSVTINREENGRGVKQAVQLETLDHYAEIHNIKQIDLVKIDVETHEPDVIAGFKNGLSKWKPTLLIEILSDEVADDLQPMFDGLGYHYYNIDERGAIIRQDRLTKSNYYNFLICQPKVAQSLGL